MTGVVLGLAEFVQRLALAPQIADLAEDGQGLVVVVDGLRKATQAQIGIAEPVQSPPLLAPVDLAHDGEHLLETVNCLLEVAAAAERVAQPYEGIAFVHSEPELAEDRQGQPVVLDGLLPAAQASIGVTEAGER